MAAPAGNPQQQFLHELIAHGHFLPSGELGIYGRGVAFERVRAALDDLITRIGADDKPERPRFPPVIPRQILEKVGYLKSFPQLCGCIFSFAGDRASALEMAERAGRGEDWSGYLSMTNVTLVPAACYPAYPAIAQRGPLPTGGVSLDLGGCYVFRNEPSGDPARLQMFHQRELVRIGQAEEVFAWREKWMARARMIFEQIGLDAKIDTASDPFFGREGKLLANSQRQQGLKFEALVPIASAERTAVASFNLHQEHFGSVFGIRLGDGGTASSSCVGFGLERVTLALFRAHGMDADGWPGDVRHRLRLESNAAAPAR